MSPCDQAAKSPSPRAQIRVNKANMRTRSGRSERRLCYTEVVLRRRSGARTLLIRRARADPVRCNDVHSQDVSSRKQKNKLTTETHHALALLLVPRRANERSHRIACAAAAPPWLGALLNAAVSRSMTGRTGDKIIHLLSHEKAIIIINGSKLTNKAVKEVH